MSRTRWRYEQRHAQYPPYHQYHGYTSKAHHHSKEERGRRYSDVNHCKPMMHEARAKPTHHEHCKRRHHSSSRKHKTPRHIRHRERDEYAGMSERKKVDRDLPSTRIFIKEDHLYCHGPTDHKKFIPRQEQDRSLDLEERVIDVFVYFVYASWCRACNILKPFVKKLAQSYQSEISTRMIDADVNQDFINMHSITELPTVLVFVGDEEVYRLVRASSYEIRRVYSICMDRHL